MNRLYYKYDVCPSGRCNVGGLLSHSATVKWKAAHDRIDWCLGYLCGEADLDRNILWSEWTNVEFCTSTHRTAHMSRYLSICWASSSVHISAATPVSRLYVWILCMWNWWCDVMWLLWIRCLERCCRVRWESARSSTATVNRTSFHSAKALRYTESSVVHLYCSLYFKLLLLLLPPPPPPLLLLLYSSMQLYVKMYKVIPEPHQPTGRHWSLYSVSTGVNFHKAVSLEPPSPPSSYSLRLSSFWAFTFYFLSDTTFAMPTIKLSYTV